MSSIGNIPNNSLPQVSIITPSFNKGRFVERTILSVLRQDYPHIQYIVVDNLSTDQTTSILEKYANKINCIIQEEDSGQSDALNKGFQRATGSVLAYLNADDCYACPSAVSKAVRAFWDDPDVDVVYGKRDYIDERGFYHNSSPYREFAPADLLLSCFIAQEACFWTHRIFEKVGACINPEYQFAMDYELWLRFLKAGAKFLSIDHALGLFRLTDDHKSTALWKTVGVPEVQRLLKHYAGREPTEDEIRAAYEKHYYGTDSASDLSLYQSLWNELVHHQKEVLCATPLDIWMLADISALEMPRVLEVTVHSEGGFFSNFNLVMSHLVHSSDDYSAIRVNWCLPQGGASHFAFGRPEDGNVWDHFFEPLPFPQHDEFMLESTRVFKDKSITGPEAYFKYQSGERWRYQYHRAFEKYIRVRPHIRERVDQFYTDTVGDRPCVGVHIRHYLHDYEQPGERSPTIREYIDQVGEILQSYPKETMVFLATDIEEAVDSFSEVFGDRLSVQPGVARTSVTSTVEVHERNPNPSVNLGEEVLADCLLLSKCDLLLHTTSNITTAVAFINPQIKMVHAHCDMSQNVPFAGAPLSQVECPRP